MLSGKKGFERVKWAFQNVLNETKTWLVVDLKNPSGLGEGAMAAFQPSIRKIEPTIEKIKEALVPALPEEVKDEDYADAAELLEWIGLAMIISPRAEKGDDVDPYLCRYQVPTAFGETSTQDLVRLRWQGFIYPAFAQSLFLAGLKAAGAEWLAISAVAFEGEAYTILVNGDHSISCLHDEVVDGDLVGTLAILGRLGVQVPHRRAPRNCQVPHSHTSIVGTRHEPHTAWVDGEATNAYLLRMRIRD